MNDRHILWTVILAEQFDRGPIVSAPKILTQIVEQFRLGPHTRIPDSRHKILSLVENPQQRDQVGLADVIHWSYQYRDLMRSVLTVVGGLKKKGAS